MTNTIQIRKSVFEILKEDLRKSIENLPTSGKGIEIVDIDDHSLIAMMVLLRFHPDEKISRGWDARILERLKGKVKESQTRGGRPSTLIHMPKYSNDPYMEAVCLIADYGKFLIELEEKQASQGKKTKRKSSLVKGRKAQA